MMLVLREREKRRKRRHPENFNKTTTQIENLQDHTRLEMVKANENLQNEHGGVYCHVQYIADGL